MSISFNESGSNQVRVSISTYKGTSSIDIRQFYKESDDGWYPTKKGVRIPITEIDKLINVLQSIKAELNTQLELF